MNVQTVGDLIAKLQKFPPELPVRVLDGFNGGGCARLINLGPVLHDQEDRDDLLEMEVDDEGAEDLEAGRDYVVMGYGCY